MADFKRTIATARAKVADAETKAFMARLDAIDAILQGASVYDVMRLAAHALAPVAATCCEEHQDEFRADFLQMLGEAVEILEDAAEPDESDEASAQVH